jgi:PASTA domain
MAGPLIRALSARCCVAGVVLTTAFLLLATGFGPGIAQAQAAAACTDNASTSGFSFTCNFALTRFQLGATNGGSFGSWIVPGFSCAVSMGTGWLECSGGNVPAGQTVTGKVTLTSGVCTPYNGLVFLNEATVQWAGRLCDSDSSDGSGSSGGGSSGSGSGSGSSGSRGGSGSSGSGSGSGSGRSGGTYKQRCVVPRLVGKTLSGARSALNRADCKLGKVTRVKASHAKRNHVLSQSVAARKRLSAGAKVNVVVGR